MNLHLPPICPPFSALKQLVWDLQLALICDVRSEELFQQAAIEAGSGIAAGTYGCINAPGDSLESILSV